MLLPFAYHLRSLEEKTTYIAFLMSEHLGFSVLSTVFSLQMSGKVPSGQLALALGALDHLVAVNPVTGSQFLRHLLVNS